MTPQELNVAVTLVKAERLVAKDWSGTSDPFAEVVIGENVKKTRVIPKCAQPVRATRAGWAPRLV